MEGTINLNRYRSHIAKTSFIIKRGKVNRVNGLVLEGDGPAVPIGSLCTVFPKSGYPPFDAEVVGFREKTTLLMPMATIQGVESGSLIESKEDYSTFNVSQGLLGRVIDGTGRPIDGKGPLPIDADYPIMGMPMNPLERDRITQPLDIGIGAVNSMITSARGQRMGILAGTGVGKSVLLGMIARNTEADVNVISLVGERGREVKEFIEENLGDEGLKRSVVVAASSEQPPVVRLRGAYIATTIAEYFRDHGKDVILMMDSITRFALAQREIGLSVGEPPTTRGYPPSVFSLLPRLLERAGTANGKGTITGLYTVLMEGDDLNEPVSDAVRAVLDGHIVLSRTLAAHNHYPAIDVLQSVSRLMIDVVSQDHFDLAHKVRDILATYREAQDLINIGAYAKGSNAKIDYAIKKIDSINEFLRQGIHEKKDMAQSVTTLKTILEAE